MVLVVPVAVLLTFVAVHAVRRGSFREAVVVAATLLATGVALVTDGLSLLTLVARQPLLVVWCAVTAIAAAVLIANWKTILAWRIGMECPQFLEILPILTVFVVGGLTLLTIAQCSPNNWDVILYHLPRQLQWLQQGSVSHFPTQDWRLTVNPPLAEYFGLHLMALADTDRLNALVSWSSAGFTLVSVSLLARDLGVSRLGQWIAAAFVATVPMMVHESVSGKNDGLVAFWFVVATWWLRRLWIADRITTTDALGFGATLGLLMLTKGTGAVFAAPIILLAPLRAAITRPAGWRPALLIAASIVLLLNAGHAVRNYRAYGSFAGQTFGLGNERHDPVTIVSNIVRNAAMHCAVPNRSWNTAVERIVDRRHHALGIAPDEPATTWGGQGFHVECAPETEHANAPLHAALLGLAGLMLPFLRGSRVWRVYGLIFIGASLAFCVVFKWQPWHPRLHLPLFALGGVAVGGLLSRPYLRVTSPMLVASLFGAALPALLASEYRTLIGSRGLNVLEHDAETLRWLGRDDLRSAADALAQRVNGSSIALINHGAFPWEYPLTRRLKRDHNLRRVGYFFPVAGSPATDTPDAVIDIGDRPPPPFIRHATGQVYRTVDAFGPFTLYEPVSPGAVPAGTNLDHPVGRFGVGAEQPASR